MKQKPTPSKLTWLKTDGDNKVLDGAQFKLYDEKTGGSEIALVKVSDGVYRLAKDDETGVDYITTVKGQLVIKGFDANTKYYLEETKAPDGYNKLAERVEIAVREGNLEASVSNDGTWEEGGVHIDQQGWGCASWHRRHGYNRDLYCRRRAGSRCGSSAYTPQPQKH